MDFVRIIRSIEELVFEVMSWLVFYPLTLWRSVFHPMAVSREVHTAMHQDIDHRFQHHLSPPLFLLLSLGIIHLVEMALKESNAFSQSILSQILGNSDLAILIFRALVFALFPLVMAVGHMLVTKQRLSRDGLRIVFFIQCFYAAPFALFASGGVMAWRHTSENVQIAAIVCVLLAVIWYIGVQVMWMRQETGAGVLKSAGHAVLRFLISIALVLSFGTLAVLS